MGSRDETGLEGRRREVMAGVEHGVEEAVEGFLVAGQHFVVGARALLGEIEAEHAANVLGREGDPVFFRGGDQAVTQGLGLGGQCCIETGGLNQFQGCQASPCTLR
eukprot:TRINITY_DN2167_c0_g1_i6.p2 TRINITY_DN2167_c0_g1~~TRINITY_DN2167_c0_g1_i6.p2  ORF type:complete len:106 (-),score=13.69 TRINITY_DN2167_c0_g1_i6:194-511(-)